MQAQQERRKTAPEIIEITNRLNSQDEQIADIKRDVGSIVENTSGMVEFLNDLEAGTRFLCRLALGVRWTLDMIKNYYAPVIVLFGFTWAMFHNFVLPSWFLKVLG